MIFFIIHCVHTSESHVSKCVEFYTFSYLQAHAFDDGTRLEETLRTFDDLVRAGKVRYIGVSNFTGWQLQKLVDTSERLGLNPIVSLQVMFYYEL